VGEDIQGIEISSRIKVDGAYGELQERLRLPYGGLRQ
jgi:hypothetical protein